MTEDRTDPPPRPAVKSYAAGVAARNLQRQEERRQSPVFPNLAQAEVTHREEGMGRTLEEVGRMQRADAASSDEPPPRAQLSEGTVEGLKAMRALQEKKLAEKEPPPKPATAPVDPADLEEEDPEDALIADAIRGAREDVIQNERERLAVAKRCGEIDLAQGLVTGEFTQVVEIVPEKLSVRYRCLTSGENTELRLYLYDQVAADRRRANLAADLLALYQTVASVVSINKHAYHKHMVPGEHGHLTFQKEIFEQKLHAFMAFPLPLIASLSTHGGWFEQRVRQLFATTDAIKNG